MAIESTFLKRTQFHVNDIRRASLPDISLKKDNSPVTEKIESFNLAALKNKIEKCYSQTYETIEKIPINQFTTSLAFFFKHKKIHAKDSDNKQELERLNEITMFLEGGADEDFLGVGCN
jgi:hypothetical protein